MIGLTIWPGAVGVARINLQGHLVGKPLARFVSGSPARLVKAAAGLLGKRIGPGAMGIGVSVPGFHDSKSRRVLSGPIASGQAAVGLSPIYEVAGELPVVIENDMHALAARWQLTHRADTEHDVLLVNIGDGALGAAVLIGGRPNRGCVSSANELGHMRYFADTERCYCGQAGCLERIFSSEYLRQIEGAGASLGAAGRGTEEGSRSMSGVRPSVSGVLMERLMAYRVGDESLEAIVDYLSNGIANVVNFIRPHRLVLVSELIRSPGACDRLTQSIRSLMLGELVDRVRFDLWDQPVAHQAETAGWLALAGLYCDGWYGG